MRLLRPFAIIIACALILSCGGGNIQQNTGNDTLPAVNMSGNWEVTATSTVATGQQFTISGHLNQTGNDLSGSVQVSSANPNCFAPDAVIAVTGKVLDKMFSVALGPYQEQVVTITGDAPDGTTATANYRVTGGCANSDAGTITGQKIAPITGTWTGSYSIPDSSAGTVSVTLTQADKQREDLLSATTLSGSGTVTGLSGFPATSTTAYGDIQGRTVHIWIQNGESLVEIDGNLSANGTQIVGTFNPWGAAPGPPAVPITLTRQVAQ